MHDWMSNDASHPWTSDIYCCIQKRSSQEELQKFRGERERNVTRSAQRPFQEEGKDWRWPFKSRWTLQRWREGQNVSTYLYGLNLGSQFYFCLFYLWIILSTPVEDSAHCLAKPSYFWARLHFSVMCGHVADF